MEETSCIGGPYEKKAFVQNAEGNIIPIQLKNISDVTVVQKPESASSAQAIPAASVEAAGSQNLEANAPQETPDLGENAQPIPPAAPVGANATQPPAVPETVPTDANVDSSASGDSNGGFEPYNPPPGEKEKMNYDLARVAKYRATPGLLTPKQMAKAEGISKQYGSAWSVASAGGSITVWGGGLTSVVGIALVIVAAVGGFESEEYVSGYYVGNVWVDGYEVVDESGTAVGYAVGGAFLGLSAVLFSVGIPLMVVGNSRIRRASRAMDELEKKRLQVTPVANLKTSTFGLGVTCMF